MRAPLPPASSRNGRTANDVRESFDGVDSAHRRESTRFTPRKLRCEARALRPLVARLEPGLRLDVACGSGSLGGALAVGCVLVGIDSNRYMLPPACASGAYHASLVADATDLPFRDGAFASGSAIRLLHHLGTDARRAVLTELRRVVRGHVVVSFFDSWTLEALRASRRRARRGSRHAIPTSWLRSDARTAGWDLVSVSRKQWRFTEHVYSLLAPCSSD